MFLLEDRKSALLFIFIRFASEMAPIISVNRRMSRYSAAKHGELKNSEYFSTFILLSGYL